MEYILVYLIRKIDSIFEEGYNKDYIYEKRINIPVLQVEHINPSNHISNMIGKNRDKMPRIGKPRPLLTMRGAIKFNMWKRTVFIKNFEYYFFSFHFN